MVETLLMVLFVVVVAGVMLLPPLALRYYGTGVEGDDEP
jgi:hypothetical protein